MKSLSDPGMNSFFPRGNASIHGCPFFVILEKGDGETVSVENEVNVNYSAMFISSEIFEATEKIIATKNNIFDSSMTFVPSRYKHGDFLLIPAWTEGLSFMQEWKKTK